MSRMEENIGALDVVLTREDLDEIEEAAGKLTIHGDRYPAHIEAITNR
jgi:aryl-alcohol dehydrogenase-like predicted oxidoreductase